MIRVTSQGWIGILQHRCSYYAPVGRWLCWSPHRMHDVLSSSGYLTEYIEVTLMLDLAHYELRALSA